MVTDNHVSRSGGMGAVGIGVFAQGRQPVTILYYLGMVQLLIQYGVISWYLHNGLDRLLGDVCSRISGALSAFGGCYMAGSMEAV